jgi:hypothetical protein
VTKRDIGAHYAVVGLLASIHRDHRARAHGEVRTAPSRRRSG